MPGPFDSAYAHTWARSDQAQSLREIPPLARHSTYRVASGAFAELILRTLVVGCTELENRGATPADIPSKTLWMLRETHAARRAGRGLGAGQHRVAHCNVSPFGFPLQKSPVAQIDPGIDRQASHEATQFPEQAQNGSPPPTGVTNSPPHTSPPHRPSTHRPLAHWKLCLHFAPSGLLGLAEAMPGMEASAPPTRAAPINLIALPREMLPLAIPLASSSKECSLACGDIVSPFPVGRGSSAPPKVTQRSQV